MPNYLSCPVVILRLTPHKPRKWAISCGLQPHPRITCFSWFDDPHTDHLRIPLFTPCNMFHCVQNLMPHLGPTCFSGAQSTCLCHHSASPPDLGFPGYIPQSSGPGFSWIPGSLTQLVPDPQRASILAFVSFQILLRVPWIKDLNVWPDTIKILRGKHRQNTRWHKSKQDLLWPTS